MLADAGISIDCVNVNAAGIFFIVATRNTTARTPLFADGPLGVRARRDCAKISIVGAGMRNARRFYQVVDALSRAGVPIIHSTDSNITVSVLVPGRKPAWPNGVARALRTEGIGVMRTGRFGPVITAMITPMHANGAVHFEEAKRLAEWLCDHGSSGLVVSGTTGEGPTMSDDEKVRLFGTVVDAVGARAAVIANTGGNDTRSSVELTRRACAAGAHAILAVGPYYNKPPQSGLIAHFTAMADASTVPVMIYNIPGRTAVNVLPETLAVLAAHPRINAVKESSGVSCRSRKSSPAHRRI